MNLPTLHRDRGDLAVGNRAHLNTGTMPGEGLGLLATGQANAESIALGPGVLEGQSAILQLGNRTSNAILLPPAIFRRQFTG